MVPSELTTKTVLLVDDDPSHLKLYSWIVNRGGYRAVTALVGSSSVTFPTVRHIDLAVMDYRLSSQLTPQDVARHIREQFNAVPIILISELLWMPDDMNGFVNTFVTKGDPEQLLERIHELIAKHESGASGSSTNRSTSD